MSDDEIEIIDTFKNNNGEKMSSRTGMRSEKVNETNHYNGIVGIDNLPTRNEILEEDPLKLMEDINDNDGSDALGVIDELQSIFDTGFKVPHPTKPTNVPKKKKKVPKCVSRNRIVDDIMVIDID